MLKAKVDHSVKHEKGYDGRDEQAPFLFIGPPSYENRYDDLEIDRNYRPWIGNKQGRDDVGENGNYDEYEQKDHGKK